jgi:hypothetical protein
METYFDNKTGRTLNVRPEAFILDKVFDPQYFLSLKNSLLKIKDENVLCYERELGRYGVNTLTQDVGSHLLAEATQVLLPQAKEIFSEDIRSTYTLWVAYKGFRANLPRHIDDNACTFTIDLCVSYDTQWPIYVEGKELLLEPNQAAVYYGEDQYHWRNKFPDPAKNKVEMIFFHFVKPDHWFFTLGMDHKQEIIRLKDEYRRKNKIAI